MRLWVSTRSYFNTLGTVEVDLSRIPSCSPLGETRTRTFESKAQDQSSGAPEHFWASWVWHAV